MSISTTAISVSFLHHHHHIRIPIPRTFSRAKPSSSTFLSLAASSFSTSNSGESEDSRWLREEQRWLREEQRWLREESRWNSERESLLREISFLRLRLQQLEAELEHRNSISEIAISLPIPRSESLALPSSKDAEIGSEGEEAQLMQEATISDSLSNASVSETTISVSSAKEKTDEDERRKPKEATISDSLSHIASDSDTTPKENTDEDERKPKAAKISSKTLKIGSEGEDVQLMQEALMKLGFYSGEEDMEYSAFSAGTDDAVRTWQSSIGVPEDGIMTAELLNQLFSSHLTDESDPLGNPNGPVFTSVTESPEIHQTIVKEEVETDIDYNIHRVYLLGENRWEEPSRVGAKKVHGAPINCIVCRGEGSIMCTECDGSGEPNVEPQFLEWVDEGLKCPYCGGVGFTPCDTCNGKITV